MKLKLILTTAIVGMALALPTGASAAPPSPPTQDSVSLTEAPAVFANGFLTFQELSATSGPSGENPTGEVTFNGGAPRQIFDSGPVTCLSVSGNTARLNFRSEFFGGVIVPLQVVDDDPDTVGIASVGRAATDCSPGSPTTVYPLTSGDITVVDAQPLPTTKAQCEQGGWEQFGFKNQGLCIAFVNHHQ